MKSAILVLVWFRDPHIQSLSGPGCAPGGSEAAGEHGGVRHPVPDPHGRHVHRLSGGHRSRLHHHLRRLSGQDSLEVRIPQIFGSVRSLQSSLNLHLYVSNIHAPCSALSPFSAHSKRALSDLFQLSHRTESQLSFNSSYISSLWYLLVFSVSDIRVPLQAWADCWSVYPLWPGSGPGGGVSVHHCRQLPRMPGEKIVVSEYKVTIELQSDSGVPKLCLEVGQMVQIQAFLCVRVLWVVRFPAPSRFLFGLLRYFKEGLLNDGVVLRFDRRYSCVKLLRCVTFDDWTHS